MEIVQTADRAPAIWAVSDGIAGNAVQARALADAVARLTGGTVETRLAQPRKPYDRLPAALWAAFGAREGGWPFTGLADGGAALARPWPGLVIGAGRRCAPAVAALKRLGGVPAVQIMDPGMRRSAFDLIVAPRHDRLAGETVVETLGGLNALDDATLSAAAERWRPRLRHIAEPRVAVLVGGPSRSADFSARGLQRLTDGLVRLAIEGAGLMVTPSRRTPRAAVDKLADALTGVGGWVWSGVGDNPYPGILGLADAVVVTADSVNMCSEAAASGKPLFVATTGRLDAKIARFHDDLAACGAARPFTGELAFWRYPPLREAERVAERVAALLGPRDAAAWPAGAEGLDDRGNA
jgi:mitochondrial fission protein ELM1